jgi:hypothetical protein
VWWQNIDSKDLVCKISGLNNLRDLTDKADRPAGMTKRKAKAKAKGRAMAWPFL